MPAEDFTGMSVSPTVAPGHIAYPTLPYLATHLPTPCKLRYAATALRCTALGIIGTQAHLAPSMPQSCSGSSGWAC